MIKFVCVILSDLLSSIYQSSLRVFLCCWTSPCTRSCWPCLPVFSFPPSFFFCCFCSHSIWLYVALWFVSVLLNLLLFCSCLGVAGWLCLLGLCSVPPLLPHGCINVRFISISFVRILIIICRWRLGLILLIWSVTEYGFLLIALSGLRGRDVPRIDGPECLHRTPHSLFSNFLDVFVFHECFFLLLFSRGMFCIFFVYLFCFFLSFRFLSCFDDYLFWPVNLQHYSFGFFFCFPQCTATRICMSR